MEKNQTKNDSTTKVEENKDAKVVVEKIVKAKKPEKSEDQKVVELEHNSEVEELKIKEKKIKKEDNKKSKDKKEKKKKKAKKNKKKKK